MISDPEQILKNMHKNAIRGIWTLVFDHIALHPEHINHISLEHDATLAHHAASQGNLYILSRLKELKCDLNMVTPNGTSVFEAATKNEEILAIVKTIAWLKGNTTIEYKDPILYMNNFKPFEQNVAH